MSELPTGWPSYEHDALAHAFLVTCAPSVRSEPGPPLHSQGPSGGSASLKPHESACMLASTRSSGPQSLSGPSPVPRLPHPKTSLSPSPSLPHLLKLLLGWRIAKNRDLDLASGGVAPAHLVDDFWATSCHAFQTCQPSAHRSADAHPAPEGFGPEFPPLRPQVGTTESGETPGFSQAPAQAAIWG